MVDSESVFPLDAVEIRVLGALMEKSVTTPEYYPMTLNRLLAGCNQRTSREPVSDYDEDDVTQALDSLRAKGLVRRVDMAGARAPKFRQVAEEALSIERAEFALLTVLCLRGAQTVGQLRARTERLHTFRDLDSVQATLEAMGRREEEPFELVRALPRRPGSKEIRFGHALGEAVDSVEGTSDEDADAAVPAPRFRRSGVSEEEFAALSARVAALEAMLASLQQEFSAFRKEFE